MKQHFLTNPDLAIQKNGQENAQENQSFQQKLKVTFSKAGLPKCLPAEKAVRPQSIALYSLRCASAVKSRINQLFIAGISLGLIFCSCKKTDDFPETPEIAYSSYAISDSSDKLGNALKVVTIKFSFKDKEGDIGLNQNDTAAPYDFNLTTTKYKKVNGEFVKGSEQHARILDLSEYAGKNGLQGYIEISVNEYLINSGQAIKYDLYILDKALHQSNVITTPEIVLN